MSNVDLQVVVEKQKRKIGKYETKLKDVISAYKSLLSEKQALEDSVKQFTTGDVNNDDLPGTSATNVDGKIASLQKSLAILTEEKSRREQAFTADKRRMLDEYESMHNELTSAKQRLQNENTALKQQVDALLSSLHHNQQNAVSQSASNLEQLDSDHKAEIAKLHEQLCQLKDVDDKLQYECEMRERIEMKYASVKENLTTQLEAALNRAKIAESQLTMTSENETNGYENRIDEINVQLTECLKENECLKHQLSKMKEEITLIAESKSHQSGQNVVFENCTFDELCEKLNIIVGKLRHDFKTDDSKLRDLCGISNAKCSHGDWEFKYGLLRQEFDQYKLRVKRRSPEKEYSNDTQTTEQANMNSALRKSLASVQDRYKCEKQMWMDEKVELKAAIDRLREELSLAKSDADKREILVKQSEQKIADEVNAQIQQHRERTVELLTDKQRELDALREILAHVRKNGASASDANLDGNLMADKSSSLAEPKDPEPTGHFELPISGDSLNLTAVNIGDLNLYYEREIARRDSELLQLKQDVQRATVNLRKTEQDALNSRLRDQELINCLKSELRRKNRLESLANEQLVLPGGGAYTTEYVRNVLLQYLLCDRADTKMHMLRALSDALKFTPTDWEKINKTQTKSLMGNFWQSSSKK